MRTTELLPANSPDPRPPEQKRLAWLLGPAAVVGVLCLATTPFWLKNWVWYGDPLYPALHRHLTLRPWHEDMGQFYTTLVERHPTPSTLASEFVERANRYEEQLFIRRVPVHK